MKLFKRKEWKRNDAGELTCEHDVVHASADHCYECELDKFRHFGLDNMMLGTLALIVVGLVAGVVIVARVMAAVL